MSICSTLCMSLKGIASSGAPLVVYLILGLVMCAMALPERKFVAGLAIAAPSIFFLAADAVTQSEIVGGGETGVFLFQVGLFGGPILFLILTLIVGLSRERKRKKTLLILSALGLLSSIAIFKTIEYGLGQIP